MPDHSLLRWTPFFVFCLTLTSIAMAWESPEDRVASLMASGRAAYEQGRYAEAEGLLELALELTEREAPLTAECLYALTIAAWTTNWDKSHRYRLELLAELELDLGPNHPAVGAVLWDLSQYSVTWKFEPLLDRSREIWAKALGPEHPGLIASLWSLGQLFQVEGRYAEAELFYKYAELIDVKTRGGSLQSHFSGTGACQRV